MVTTTSKADRGSCRARAEIVIRLAPSAQWTSSATSMTGRSAHDVSTRSTISSTIRYRRSPPAGGDESAPWPARSAAMAAFRGSGERRLRPSAAATTPKGRVRSNGWAWPQNAVTPLARACSRRSSTSCVLPMPASPSMVSVAARPPPSSSSPATSAASSPSRPTGPSVTATAQASPSSGSESSLWPSLRHRCSRSQRCDPKLATNTASASRSRSKAAASSARSGAFRSRFTWDRASREWTASRWAWS